MKPVLIIWAAGALFFPALCFASEEYDPLLYPEAAAAEADAAAMPSSGETLLASPKLLDEEDMNFENLDFDALDGEPQSTPMPAAAPSAVTPPPPPASSSLPAAPAEKETAPVVDKNKTLTDNLQANAPSTEDSVIPLPKVEETWISKIKSPLGEADSAKAAGDEEKQTGKVNLENLVEKSKKPCGVPMPRFLIFPAPCSACLSNRLMIFLPAAVSAARCKSWIFRILSAGAMKTNAAHPASSAMSVWKTALSKWQRKTAISMWSAPLIPSLTPERK